MTRSRDLADSADKDISGTLTLDDIVLSNDMTVADNGKVIFGAGSDLQIYHDGNSKIADVGDGKLELHSNGTGVFIQKGATEYMGKFETDGAVTLYYDNSPKLATTSSGVDVTGDVGGDSLTINNSGQSQSLVSVGGGSTNAALSLRGSTGSAYAWQISSNAHVASALEFTRSSAVGNTTFSTPSMVVDSAGNLMVGKTSLGISNVGHTLAAAGYTEFTRNTGGALNVGRNGNDGALAQLFKDGSVFGKIGVASSDNLNIYSTAADHAGLEFATHKIEPLEAGSGSNGTIDIGAASAQFKNMYLSGSIVLSGSGEGIVYGSGAANTLSDYEEGSYNVTAYLSGGGSVSFTGGGNSAFYTKIGRLCTVGARLDVSSVSSPSGHIYLSLPFVGDFSNDSSGLNIAAAAIYNPSSNLSGQLVAEVTNSYSTSLIIRHNGGIASGVTTLGGYIDGGSLISFTISYVVA